MLSERKAFAALKRVYKDWAADKLDGPVPVLEALDVYLRARAEGGAGEADWPISKDGPNAISDHRRWLARQLMDSKLTEEEAFGIVAHFPGLAAGQSATGKSVDGSTPQTPESPQ